MPGLLPVQCRPTVARQLQPPVVRAQVVKPIRNGALEPCPFLAAVQTRHLQPNPGPLEGHRRMSKRHMTGSLSPIAATPQPNWNFVFDTGIETWKWEAPTSAASRKEKKEGFTGRALFNRMLNWLEGTDADLPFLTPPPASVHSPSKYDEKESRRELAAVPNSKSVSAVEEKADTLAAIRVSRAPPLEILQLRRSIRSLATPDATRILELSTKCCKALRIRVENGSLSATELCLALEPLDKTTLGRISNSRLVRDVVRSVRKTIITTMHNCSLVSPTKIPADSWLAVARKLHTLADGADHDPFFRMILAGIPSQAVSRLSPEQFFGLFQRAQAASAHGSHMPWKWIIHASSISRSLQKLSNAQREKFEILLQAYLRDDTICRQESRQRRLTWIMTAAMSPAWSSQDVMDLFRKLIREEDSLNSQQLWLLLTSRLIRIGAIHGHDRKMLMDAAYPWGLSRWHALLKSLTTARSDHREVGIRELQFWLGEPKVMQGLLDEITDMALSPSDAKTAEGIATALYDYRLAYELYNAVRTNDDGGEYIKQWRWTTWLPHVEQMVKDPKIEPYVWSMLSLRRGIHTKPEEIDAKVKLLDKMVEWYTEITFLTDRQLLRRYSQIASAYRDLTEGVPLQLISCLTKVITKDLEMGDFGRKTRLVWLLKLIAEKAGPATAKQSAEKLTKWREVIHWAQKNMRQAVPDKRLDTKK